MPECYNPFTNTQLGISLDESAEYALFFALADQSPSQRLEVIFKALKRIIKIGAEKADAKISEYFSHYGRAHADMALVPTDHPDQAETRTRAYADSLLVLAKGLPAGHKMPQAWESLIDWLVWSWEHEDEALSSYFLETLLKVSAQCPVPMSLVTKAMRSEKRRPPVQRLLRHWLLVKQWIDEGKTSIRVVDAKAVMRTLGHMYLSQAPSAEVDNLMIMAVKMRGA